MTRLSATLAAASAVTFSWAQAPVYSVVNLGSLNGQSEAFAINANGQAVGWTFTTAGTRRAALFDKGTVTPLATPAGKNSKALGIDKLGRIVGQVDRTAAVWTSPQGYMTLGTLGGGQESFATALNDNSVVSVTSQDGNAYWRPAYYVLPASGLISLARLGGPQGGAASCSNGNIVGFSDLANGKTHAVIWANGNTLDFGTLGGPVSQFLASSEQGNAAGWSYLTESHRTPMNNGFIKRAIVNGAGVSIRNLGEPYMARPYPTVFGPYRGFVWRYYVAGKIQQSNVVGVDVVATGINSDTVVGTATLYLYPSGTLTRAVAWVNGAFYDLTNVVATSGWTLRNAWGVNKKGQIVGQGTAPNGQLLAYRLDRVTNGSGLSFARFTGVTQGTLTPTFATTTQESVIPTVTLYVRKSDGLTSLAPGGPYTSDGFSTWVQTSPVKVAAKLRLLIDERGTPASPNGVANWNSVCNGLQSSYQAFSTSGDGSLKAQWGGQSIRDTLNSFPNDNALTSRWRFSVNGTSWLSIRLVLRKGAGY